MNQSRPEQKPLTTGDLAAVFPSCERFKVGRGGRNGFLGQLTDTTVEYDGRPAIPPEARKAEMVRSYWELGEAKLRPGRLPDKHSSWTGEVQGRFEVIVTDRQLRCACVEGFAGGVGALHGGASAVKAKMVVAFSWPLDQVDFVSILGARGLEQSEVTIGRDLAPVATLSIISAHHAKDGHFRLKRFGLRNELMSFAEAVITAAAERQLGSPDRAGRASSIMGGVRQTIEHDGDEIVLAQFTERPLSFMD